MNNTILFILETTRDDETTNVNENNVYLIICVIIKCTIVPNGTVPTVYIYVHIYITSTYKFVFFLFYKFHYQPCALGSDVSTAPPVVETLTLGASIIDFTSTGDD